jgi:hypothetical protein
MFFFYIYCMLPSETEYAPSNSIGIKSRNIFALVTLIILSFCTFLTSSEFTIN